MKMRNWAAAALLVCAAILIAVGVLTGQPAGVHTKATTICLECIGIG